MAYDDHSESQQARPQSTADHTVQPPLPPLHTKEADTALPQVEVSSTESGPAVNSGEGPDETEQSSPSEEEEWRSSEQDNMESVLAAGCHDIDNFDDNNIDAYSSGDDGDGGNGTEMSLDTLTLEMEVQELIHRVALLEQGHSAVLNNQRSTLQKQEHILSRLAALERQQHHYTSARAQPPSFNDYSFDNSFADLSFDDSPKLPAYIPPPPLHPPPSLNPPPTQRPSRNLLPTQRPLQHPPPTQQPSLNPLPTQRPLQHPPPTQQSSLHQSHQQLHSPPAPKQSLPPLPAQQHVQLLPSEEPRQHSASVQSSISNENTKGKHLPSSAIDRTKLVPAKVVVDRNQKLMCESKVPKLALKLARESFFGEKVMIQCTFGGERELPGLTLRETQLLKNQILTMFPLYWNSPAEFEPLWTMCTESIGQGCKRLRSK